MKSMILLEAVGNIKDSYVNGALDETLKEAPRSRKPARRRLWIAAAACLCLIIGGFLYMHAQGAQSAPGFAITAYAKSQGSENAEALLLKLSKRIPISKFDTETGESIFAFSYETADPDHPAVSAFVNDEPIVTIVSDGSYYTESATSLFSEGSITFAGITGIKEQKGNIYVYYHPDTNSQLPYYLSIPAGLDGSDGKSSDYAAQLVITQSDGQYYVELTGVEKKCFTYNTIPNDDDQKEITDWLINWIKPYLSVMSKLNEEFDVEMSLSKDDYWNFYEHYQNKTVEEFESEVRKDLENIGIK